MREVIAYSQGKVWRVPVEAYDPRDLLRGRYAIFNFELAGGLRQMATATCSEKAFPPCRLCIRHQNGTNNTPEFMQLMKGEDSKHCVSTLEGSAFEQFLRQQRFYLPEAIADRVDINLRNRDNKASADVVIVNPTTYRIKNLYINGVSVLK